MGHVDVVRDYIAAVERCDVEAVKALLHAAVRFHELPNRIRPKGGVDDRDAMIAGLERAASGSLLSAQRYHVGRVLTDGETVVVEARWEGELAVPVGALAAGEAMIAHLCMIFTVRDGLIIEQRNYDCYEDFTAKA